MKYVWKGHGGDWEIGNVSARQAALNHCMQNTRLICPVSVTNLAGNGTEYPVHP